MPLTLLLAFQAAAQAAPPLDFDLSRVRPLDFDLREFRGSYCPPGEDGAIVVCGRRLKEGYPLERMEREFAVRPPVAEVGLGGNVRGRAFVEQAEMPNGEVSNRIMLGIRLPF